MSRPDYLEENRDTWNRNAAVYAERAEISWRQAEPTWGIWGIPESSLHLLRDVEGRDFLEAGCGTGYVSAWASRKGARVIGLDNSPAQLATARRMQARLGPRFPLVLGVAEELPFSDRSLDVVFSEYGAAIWSDPYLWIPEAARVLRPAGELIVFGNSSLLMLCMPERDAELPVGNRLHNDYFGMHRWDWPDDPGIEFHIGTGDWIRLFRANGFEVLDLLELQAPPGARTRYEYVELEWARRWPSEQVWRVRKR